MKFIDSLVTLQSLKIISFIILGTVLIRFAVPLVDTDLWWQMAYGRYFSLHDTLTLDHSIFTWSPSAQHASYNAWIAQVLLFQIYDLGGLELLFALRYAALLAFVAMGILTARKFGVLNYTITLPVVLISVLMSEVGVYLKPEIFSYFLFTVLVTVWSLSKMNPDAHRIVYLYPLIMLLWINTHGGFIFGGLFLGLIFIGEILNSKYSLKIAAGSKRLKHLSFSLAMCALTLVLTPYGIDYPLDLVDRLLAVSAENTARNSLFAIGAYKSIFYTPSSQMELIAYLLFAISLTTSLILMSRKVVGIDFSIVLTNLVFAILYASVIRTSYFLAPIFCMSVLLLLSSLRNQTPANPKSLSHSSTGKWIAITFCLAISTLTIYSNKFNANYSEFLPYNAYIEPLSESQFIKALPAHYKVGNDYGIGGYLLWDLDPKKILIDPRFFPFTDWFEDYLNFSQGKNISEFLETYPADVWILSFEHKILQNYFLNSKDWQLAFYGPTASVYLSTSQLSSSAKPATSEEINNIKSISHGLRAIQFSAKIGDTLTANKIIKGLKRNFPSKEHQTKIRGNENYLNGIAAYKNGVYDQAAKLLLSANHLAGISDEGHLFHSFNLLAEAAWNEERNQDAWTAFKDAARIKPSSVINGYNLGVTGWYLSKTGEVTIDTEWDRHLANFISLSEDNPRVPKLAVEFAKDILKGSFQQKPQIIISAKISEVIM
jgi:hypothetical protein